MRKLARCMRKTARSISTLLPASTLDVCIVSGNNQAWMMMMMVMSMMVVPVAVVVIVDRKPAS